MWAIECKLTPKREQTELTESAGACTEAGLSRSVASVLGVLSIVVLVVLRVCVLLYRYVLSSVSICSDVISVSSPNFT